MCETTSTHHALTKYVKKRLSSNEAIIIIIIIIIPVVLGHSADSGGHIYLINVYT